MAIILKRSWRMGNRSSKSEPAAAPDDKVLRSFRKRLREFDRLRGAVERQLLKDEISIKQAANSEKAKALVSKGVRERPTSEAVCRSDVKGELPPR